MSKLPLLQEGGRNKRKAKFDQLLSLANKEENFRKIQEDLHSCIEATVFRSNSKHILVIGFFFFCFAWLLVLKQLFLIHFLYKYFESYTCLQAHLAIEMPFMILFLWEIKFRLQTAKLQINFGTKVLHKLGTLPLHITIYYKPGFSQCLKMTPLVLISPSRKLH